MFYDQITGRLSKPGEGTRKILLAKRDRAYTRWEKNEEDNQWYEVFVSMGWEILKELNTTLEGETIWNSWSVEEQQSYLHHNYPHLVKEIAKAAEAARKVQAECKPARKERAERY